MLKEIIALTERVIPNYSSQFVFETIPSFTEKDVFEIDSKNNKIIIRGNSILSMAAGLGWYLKYTANCNLSWCGSRINLPEQLPIVIAPYRRVIDQQYRAYMNYCTFNYSASWWEWKRWEQEIDYMALNGINLPLSVVGVEGVWYDTLTDFGFSDQEAREFLCGPSFLAWQWMTNIEGFCGPLPKKWIDRRVELGRKIIQRQIELGMQPIQQGFSGYVPRKLQEKFPDARIQIKESWCGFEGIAQLDPTDPLFEKLGKLFLNKQKKLFGTYGYYAVDPFHEGKPPVQTKDYLNGVGNAITCLLTDFDEQAIWVTQSWSIRYDIISVTKKDRLLVLDIAGGKHPQCDNFWGYPFVTGNLHNFGGRINLHGDMHKLAENQYSEIKKTAVNVCGTGLLMEAIGQNPAYYDLAFEMLTRSDSIALSDWTHEYVGRRYGEVKPEALKAWGIFLNTIYAQGTNGVEKSSIICARPAITVKKSGPNDGLYVPYGNRRLFLGLELLYACNSNSEGFQYDVVDILRQVLSNYGQKLYIDVLEHFKNKEEEEFLKTSKQFIELLNDVDKLISIRKEFRLDQWIEDARSWGDTDEEKKYYEYNASTLITLWGSEKDALIFDYAWKEWSGLIKQYYLRRWEQFFAMLADCLQKGEEYIEDTLKLTHGREAFRANHFYDKLADWEGEWVHSIKSLDTDYPDFNETVSMLLKKYGAKL